MPKIAFGITRSYTPDFEAASKEIAWLRDAASDVVVASLPLRSNPFRHEHAGGVFTGHPFALRISPAVRRALGHADILHVWAPVPLPRRVSPLLAMTTAPKLLTVISVGASESTTGGFDKVVAESPRDRDRLGTGVRVVPPAADLTPLPDPPSGDLTLAFASWPFEPDEASSRGLDLMAELARRHVDVRFLILTRPGSRVSPTDFDFPSNVTVRDGVCTDLRKLWRGAHAVIAPFRDSAKRKSVPNSVVEALAAGRPALVTNAIALGDWVGVTGAGVVAAPSVDSLSAAIDRMQRDYESMRQAALEHADEFSVEAFRQAYREIYDELI